MSFSRKAITALCDWHQEDDRKPLLLRGARQVGKSWAVAEFSRRTKLNLVTLNFEERPSLAGIFEADLDIERIVNQITTLTGVSIRDPNTLLFFDEIQRAPKALLALRYFYEKAPEIGILAAGSLVEFILEEHGLPVGRVKSHFMYPLDFGEFLLALNKKGLAETLTSFKLGDTQSIAPVIHEELLSYLKLYFQLGGMPKVVASYLEKRDIIRAAEEQSLIIQGYRDDLRKYAKRSDWNLLDAVFEKMGSLAGSSPIKFSTISREAKSVQIRRALVSLEQAMVTHRILLTNAAKLPLAAHSSDKKFKLAFLDIGLLHHQLGFDWRIFDDKSDLTDIASGRFAEQFVAQELIATRSALSPYRLHYWEREEYGSQAEIDFVIEYNDQPIPIEVKSSTGGRLKSLDQYFKAKNPKFGIVFSQRNVKYADRVTYLPLYLAGQISA